MSNVSVSSTETIIKEYEKKSLQTNVSEIKHKHDVSIVKKAKYVV